MEVLYSHSKPIKEKDVYRSFKYLSLYLEFKYWRIYCLGTVTFKTGNDCVKYTLSYRHLLRVEVSSALE